VRIRDPRIVKICFFTTEKKNNSQPRRHQHKKTLTGEQKKIKAATAQDYQKGGYCNKKKKVAI